MANKKAVNLEKTLADLESLVEELESGELPLDDAMKKFEKGVKLTRICQHALKEADIDHFEQRNWRKCNLKFGLKFKELHNKRAKNYLK